MVAGDIISAVVFNSDRILLQMFVSGTAVTIYYLSSLVGKTMSLISTPLNGVITGYLSRYKGRLTAKLMNLAVLLSLGLILFFSAGSYLGSYILIPLLYPDEYVMAKPFFLIGNAAQVVYFVTNMISVLLIRFSKMKFQLYINISYAILFALVCIPSTYLSGVRGIMWGLFCVNTLRYLLTVLYGYITVKSEHNNMGTEE